MKQMNWEEFDWLIQRALAEDGVEDDVTTDALIDPEQSCEAEVVVRGDGVICGLRLAARLVAVFDGGLTFRPLCEDGARVGKGAVAASLAGSAASVLKIERTLLNFLQRLSGIATLARSYCEAVEGTGSKIYDTRKTTPGWRRLEKYAVHCGGAENHRADLTEHVLIKDNHLHLMAKAAGAGNPARVIRRAVQAGRLAGGNLLVEVEVESLEELSEALLAEPDLILLDNMSPEQILRAAEMVRQGRPGVKRPLLEASGGINLSNVRAYAEAGADRISVGALTHSVPALDMSLRIR